MKSNLEKAYDLLDKMKKAKIQYGFIRRSDNKPVVDDGNLDDTLDFRYYTLMKPSEIWSSKVCVCNDATELEREYFEKNKIPCKRYYIEVYDKGQHSFTTFIDKNKIYWFEYTFAKIRGIHGPFNDENALLKELKEKYSKYTKIDFSKNEYIIAEIKNKLDYGINWLAYQIEALKKCRVLECSKKYERFRSK